MSCLDSWWEIKNLTNPIRKAIGWGLYLHVCWWGKKIKPTLSLYAQYQQKFVDYLFKDALNWRGFVPCPKAAQGNGEKESSSVSMLISFPLPVPCLLGKFLFILWDPAKLSSLLWRLPWYTRQSTIFLCVFLSLPTRLWTL